MRFRFLNKKQGQIRFIIFLAVFFLVILSPLYLGLWLSSTILTLLGVASFAAVGLYYIIKFAVIAALKESGIRIEREPAPNNPDLRKDRETS